MTRIIILAGVCWTLAMATTWTIAAEQVTRRPANPHLNLDLFTHSDNCVACHNQLTSNIGEDVSIGTMWRATIMANSSRDPYWQASVRRETIDHPTHSAEIQDECAACHMPMPRRIAAEAGRQGEVFSHLPISKDQSELQRLAGDGVSCTVCHQIAADRLGTRDSFNANFVLALPQDGIRTIYGNHDVDPGRRRIMRSVTGYQQEAAPHIKQSELCASCHTLITKALGPDGGVIGELHEQMNFQEWKHSDYEKEARSCQSCHMPAEQGPIRISSVLGESRDSLAKHVFVGGNAHMLRILSNYRGDLGVAASEAELATSARLTIQQLQHDTATLSVNEPRIVNGQLAFDVRVTNTTGHKFPTGYPSRRTWLHVTVKDATGKAVFESGAVAASGAIDGNENDRDKATYEPHYDEITSAAQVQIYESILGDRNGGVTTGLLTATQYLKDNRLLPRGFDKTTAPPEIGVFGDAIEDADFSGGSDVTKYRVRVTGVGPYRVESELRYQSIGFRWAHNLDGVKGDEPARFISYYRATIADAAVVVATASTNR
jgi:hypothetical protein